MYYTYILRSLKDRLYYYGSTGNLSCSRLKEHNYGHVRSTKSHRPYVIHYYENFDTKSAALKREKFFKSINGYIWLKENGII
jgi:putative endonuclease